MAYASKKKLSDNSIVPIGSNLYGTCSTASGTSAKVVSMPDFNVLVEGVTIHVYFANKNTASSPTLKVGSTDAKPIRYNGQADGSWENGSFISFTYYNGSWVQNDITIGGVTYTFTIDDHHTLVISGSDGSEQYVALPDNDTTYSFYLDGYNLIISPSEGTPQIIPLPKESAFIADFSTSLNAICDAFSASTAVYFQYWNDVSTIRLLPLAELDCSDHATFMQVFDDANGTRIVYATVNNQNDWTMGDIPLDDGVTSYNDLTDKPQIEGVTLSGDKTYDELNLIRITNAEIETLTTTF